MTNTPAPVACACLITLACAMSAAAQVAPAPTPAPAAGAAAPAEARTSADEDFELNIGERRITEESFEASTEVEVGDGGEPGRGVNLRVGVAASAARIDVLLRNVRGRVRFRASLDDVLRRLGLRRRDDAPTTPPPP